MKTPNFKSLAKVKATIMKNQTLKLLSILFSIMLASSCSSDDDGSEPESMVAELITDEDWYLESFGDFVLGDCDKQSIYNFTTDESLVIDAYGYDGEFNCNFLGNNNLSWELLSDTEFIITEDGEDLMCEIITLTEDEFVFDVGEDSFRYVLDKNPGDG